MKTTRSKQIISYTVLALLAAAILLFLGSITCGAKAYTAERTDPASYVFTSRLDICTVCVAPTNSTVRWCVPTRNIAAFECSGSLVVIHITGSPQVLNLKMSCADFVTLLQQC